MMEHLLRDLAVTPLLLDVCCFLRMDGESHLIKFG